MTDDPFDLRRFVDAQSAVWDQVLDELRRGRKTSHWMWFVFPQVDGLGSSQVAKRYAIRSIEEARAYLAHPVLGPRIREAVAAIAGHSSSARAILGDVDAAKLRSSMTLFEAAAVDPRPFGAIIDRFFGGERDGATIARL